MLSPVLGLFDALKYLRDAVIAFGTLSRQMGAADLDTVTGTGIDTGTGTCGAGLGWAGLGWAELGWHWHWHWLWQRHRYRQWHLLWHWHCHRLMLMLRHRHKLMLSPVLGLFDAFKYLRDAVVLSR
jgi:hypothetical protein